jgi:hypothetical protein
MFLTVGRQESALSPIGPIEQNDLAPVDGLNLLLEDTEDRTRICKCNLLPPMLR